MRQIWNTLGFWTLDISDENNSILIYGVKLIAGEFILKQYPEILFDIKIDGDIDPTSDNLTSLIVGVYEK